MGFKLPPHPNSDRENPFEDEQGNNPFSDPDSPSKPDAPLGDEYAAPQGLATSGVDDDHVQSYPHRARLILTLGILGQVISLLGIAGIVVGMSRGQSMLASLSIMSCTPLAFLSIVFSGPAWLMGRQDTQAIRAGAMDPSGQTGTLIGMILGIAATLVSFLIGGMFIFVMIRTVLSLNP